MAHPFLNLPRTKRTIPIGSYSVHLEWPADPDHLLEAALAKGEVEAETPYWADLWHSAIALGEVLTQDYPDLRGRVVTEIGCGLGLPGIVAGLCGASVTLTDYLPEAVAYAQHNWQLNVATSVRSFPMDWRAPSAEAKADLLLAADIAYEPAFFNDLTQAFRQLLRPSGIILLAEPGRPRSQHFLEVLSDAGFQKRKHWVIPVRLDGSLVRVGVYAYAVPSFSDVLMR